MGALIAGLLAFVVAASAAAATPVYRCQGPTGPVFSDHPCGAQAKVLPPATPNVIAPTASADLARAHDERAQRERTAGDKQDTEWLKQHAARKADDERIRNAMVEGRVVRGMTEAQVRQAWGSPDEVEQQADAGGDRQRWVWNDAGRRRSASFTDGRVTGASDRAAGKKKR